jgi:hypothetical protein
LSERLEFGVAVADAMGMAADTLLSADYVALIDAVRLELQDAGNPAFIVAVRDAAGAPQLSPMVFAAVGPAAAYAERVATSAAGDERVLIISRQASHDRQFFDVLEPATLRRLHLHQEVIEASVAEAHGPI